MESQRRIGLVIAAGRGRRMGGRKQLAIAGTPAGAKPLIAAAFDAISWICAEMVVVLGHEASAAADALAPRPFHRVDCDPDGEMIDSIRAGLRIALHCDAQAIIVLQPGDHPWVERETLEQLCAAQQSASGRAVIPEYHGRGGHPVLIPPELASQLIHEPCPGGLARYWAEHAAAILRVPVEDAAVVRDVDTPEQLPG